MLRLPRQVPSASMSLFNTLSIILLIPVYDKWLEPAISKLRRGNKITLLQRIGACCVLRARCCMLRARC